MKRLFRFLRLPQRDKRVFLEAAMCLCWARLLLLVPFRRVVPLIGRAEPGLSQSIIALTQEERALALVIRHALARAAKALPWRSSCLACAIGGSLMLRRRGLPSALHLGVQSDPRSELSAHAWLHCGDVDIVGAEIASEFVPVAAFRS